MSTLVSVVTAVYNDENFIKQSVESILNQTFSEFEYIIVDDGSTDNTMNILNEIAKKDKRIIIISQKNQGPAAARNIGINSAKGTYIAIQDSDDISLPCRLQKQLEQLLLNTGNNLISCTDYKIIDTSDRVIATNSKSYKNITEKILSGKFCICHPTIMLPKELITKAGGYNAFYNKSKVEDFDLILRILENNACVEKINECLLDYRIRDSGSIMNNDTYEKRVMENHVNRVNHQPENFTEIANDYRKEKNYIVKRKAREIFYAENYFKYVKFYTKCFYKLPINNYFLFFIYAICPFPIKRALKSIYT